MKQYITTERTDLFEPNSVITMKCTIEGPASRNETASGNETKIDSEVNFFNRVMEMLKK